MTDETRNESGYTYRYPRPAVTADVVFFSLLAETLHVLLIQRKHPPFEGMWAFPGGFVEMNEDLRTAALRELREETSLFDSSIFAVEQLHAFGAPDRDPRQRTISIAYLALAPWDAMDAQHIQGADDAAEARWWPVVQLPELAFDHAHIMRVALQRLSECNESRRYVFQLLPQEFTHDEYRAACRAISNEAYDADELARQIAVGTVVTTGRRRIAAGVLERLYRLASHATSS